MNVRDSLLPEFDREMANTRSVLERVPGDKLNWKAHEKSNTIGWVATHLADLPGWIIATMKQDSLDFAPPGGAAYQMPKLESVPVILDRFDKNVAAGRDAIVTATEPQFFEPWSLLKGGVTLFTMPRIAVLRSFVMNHSIHHRGHLCVYLRLNNVPVPGLYGPSADAQTM
jgi:uncharacterized damage-inducible protein DinB